MLTDTAEMALLQRIRGTSHDTELEGKLGEFARDVYRQPPGGRINP